MSKTRKIDIMPFTWFNPRHKGNRHFTFTRSPETRLVPPEFGWTCGFPVTLYIVCWGKGRCQADHLVRMLRQVVDFIISNFSASLLLFVLYYPLSNEVWDLHGKPRSELKRRKICDVGKTYNESNNSNKDVTLTPSAIKWASPNFGTFLAHSGLKWSVRQILPPLLGWNKNVILQTVLASHRKQKEQKNKRTCTSLPSCHLVQGLPLQEPSRDTWPESSNRVGFKKDIDRFKEYMYRIYGSWILSSTSIKYLRQIPCQIHI